MSDVAELSLFEVDSLAVPTVEKEKLSATRRLTIRNENLLARGIHPASGFPLLVTDAKPAKCRTCLFKRYVNAGANSYNKCEKHRLGMSRSNASDIRVSWCACTLYVDRDLSRECGRCNGDGWREMTPDELSVRPTRGWQSGATRTQCEDCNGRGLVVP